MMFAIAESFRRFVAERIHRSSMPRTPRLTRFADRSELAIPTLLMILYDHFMI